MASLTMTASFLGGATTSTVTKNPSTRRGLIVAKASRAAATEGEKANMEFKNNPKVDNSSSGRRELVLAAAAAAAAAFSVTKVATAEEPKRGSAEAKKKYAPICVTMPTARICRN